MDCLNLDELVKVNKTIKYKGKDYAVKELTVEAFLAAMAEAKELEARGKPDAHENMERTVAHIQSLIPDFPAKDLRKLEVHQLIAIVAFVNGNLKEQGAKPEPAQEGADAKN